MHQDMGMGFGIEKCIMLIMKKVRKRNNGRNRTTKSGKHQNIWSKRKLKLHGNIGRC